MPCQSDARLSTVDITSLYPPIREYTRGVSYTPAPTPSLSQMRTHMRRHRRQGVRLHRPRVHGAEPAGRAAQPSVGGVRDAPAGTYSAGASLRSSTLYILFLRRGGGEAVLGDESWVRRDFIGHLWAYSGVRPRGMETGRRCVCWRRLLSGVHNALHWSRKGKGWKRRQMLRRCCR